MLFTLINATAIILYLTAQSLIITPHLYTTLVQYIPLPLVYLFASIVYLVSILGFSTILSRRNTKRRNVIYLLMAISLAFLTYFYSKAFIVETILFSGLAVGIGISLWKPRIIYASNNNLLEFSTILINIILGMMVFGWPEKILYHSNLQLLTLQLPIAAIFLISGTIGLLELFSSTNITRKFIPWILALPWIIWGALILTEMSIPQLIPTITLIISLQLKDTRLWDKLGLPSDHILGRRLLQMVGVANGFLLVIVALLLNFGEIISPETPTITANIHLLREITLIFLIGVSIISAYTIGTISFTVNGQRQNSKTRNATKIITPLSPFSEFINSLISPFSAAQLNMRHKLELQDSQIAQTLELLETERRRSLQLSLLFELSQQLNSILDLPVAGQLTVNAIQRAYNCSLVTLFDYDTDRNEFVSMANSGQFAYTIPPGYRQSDKKGILGRAYRQRKTQIVSDTEHDPDYYHLEMQTFRSEIVVPLIHNGRLRGAIAVDDERPNTFSNADNKTIEAFSALLVDAWERSAYQHRMSNLIQAGINLSTLMDPQAAIRQLAAISQEALEAKFVFVTLLDREGNFSRSAYAGFAPEHLRALTENETGNDLILAVLNSQKPIRTRDLRKFSPAQQMPDHPSLRSLLAFPIRLHKLSIGAVLAFGKQSGLFFEETDESFINLLAAPAAATIESTWLYQELRNALNTATLLYQLSTRVIQAEKLSDAATSIAETALKLGNASLSGIVLLTLDGDIEAQVEVDASGPNPGYKHPMTLIKQVVDVGQSVMVSEGINGGKICLPLQTHLRNYGALWLDIPESRWYNSRYAANLQTLANQAAIALERALLLVETRRQAFEIKTAYNELSTTYDQTLISLISALDARDKETEGHSNRVGKLTSRLGEKLNLDAEQLKSLERGAILHDIGKIGISDNILHKPGPLNDNEWKIMKAHPHIGAKIIEGIPFLEEALPIIRFHHERWDGSGYPMGLKGTEIPLTARIFAIADAFDALISDRPYRGRISVKDALKYLNEQSGVLFDPEAANIFSKMVSEGEVSDLLTMP